MSITLPLEQLLLLPLAIQLVVLFGIAVYYGVIHRQRYDRKKANIYRCAVCNYVYLDGRNVPLSRCTRCSCLNEAIRR